MLNHTTPCSSDSSYKGRFAPSATGDLHLGSLVTALACALDAHQKKGSWIIRIDDIDHTRCHSTSSQSISRALAHYFKTLPFSDLYHQSDTISLYTQAFNALASQGLVYQCSCSRKDLAQLQQTQEVHLCRTQVITAFSKNTQNVLRFKSNSTSLQQQLIEDAILFRRDGCFSYHFSCVINDEADGITHIIRGADLIDAEQPQTQLIKALGYKKPLHYYVPLVENQQGQKLSKQNKARPITIDARAPEILRQALLCLKWPGNSATTLPKTQNMTDLMHWAVQHWQAEINFIQSPSATFAE